MAQRLSAPGAAFLRHHEGFVEHWYLDPVGVPTIGVGFTWASASFREWWERNRPGQKFAKDAKMTRAEADAALIFMCEMEYGKAVGGFLGREVKQHVFDGMTSPVFNLGPGSLEWKWAAAAKAGDLKEAAELLRTTGTTAKGVKLKGLVIRRQEEAELLETGDYTIGVNKVYDDPLADGVLVRGERGAPVVELQTRLKALGLYTGNIDGIFGFGTEAAVLAFQRAQGLEADGWAGPKTLGALAGPPADEIPHHPEPSAPPATKPKPDGLNWPAIIIFAALAALAAAFFFLRVF